MHDDDDGGVLELSKTTLPSHSNLKLIASALRRKSVEVLRIISMIEEMMTLLQTKQSGDDNHEACCLERFDTTEEHAKEIAGQEQLDDGVATDIRRKQRSEFVPLAANRLATIPEGSKEGRDDDVRLVRWRRIHHLN